MKSITTVAYPSIPIVFLGGINADRIPLYDTMGLAVTNTAATTRTETTITLEATNSQSLEVNFNLNGNPLTGLRGQQIINSIKSFAALSDFTGKITVDSSNHDIFSGSSDSGLAALYTGLNASLGLNYSKSDLIDYAMRGSESAGRSLFGGLTLTKIVNGTISVEQIASAQKLSDMKLFSIPFHYDSRISADEIHAGIVKHDSYQSRVEKIPFWISKIIQHIDSGKILGALQYAEENIQNAHELLEEVGIQVRKPEMLKLCDEIQTLRKKQGIKAYFLIGGGNLVTLATTGKYAESVENYLTSQDWHYTRYKVASSPIILQKNL